MHPSSAFSRFKSFGAVLFLYLAAVIVIPSTLGDSTSNAETGEGSESGGDPSTSGGGSSGGPPPEEPKPNPAAPLGTPTKVGYKSIADGTVPGGNYAFMNFSTGSVVVIPFRFDSLENYTLTSANLLLRTSSGTVSLSDLSVQVYDTLPSNSTSLPTPVASFASIGDITSTLGIHTFTATSSLTLEADTTYYFGVSYFGSHTFAWNATSNDPTGIGPLYVSDTFLDGTTFSYYVINTGSLFTDVVVGGFSITAAAVSAVPEPATTAVLAAGAVLAAALWVRWRRRRAGLTDEERPPQA
jgi:PEP-CTERM putative exosortase interaction domain